MKRAKEEEIREVSFEQPKPGGKGKDGGEEAGKNERNAATLVDGKQCTVSSGGHIYQEE